MSSWSRLAPLGGIPSDTSEEKWIYHRDDGSEKVYPVRVTNGKALNVVGLKGLDLQEVRDYNAYLRENAEKLYGPQGGGRRIGSCPCCGGDTGRTAVEWGRFVDVPLHRCRICGHAFVLDQPTSETLNASFADSETLSSVYVDRESLDVRMREIIAPKLEWVLDVYRLVHDGQPASVLDVGAGGGHFVAGTTRRGIEARGFELSQASRAFAKEAFDLNLLGTDFLAAEPSPMDLVTFWGLLEYTPSPRDFLEAARKWLVKNSGMLIVEVPRIDCVGTAVQKDPDSIIARHIDPTSHVNTFSDAGIATALVECGFRPVAAWYFGMDIYEVLVQASLRLDSAEVLDQMADLIGPLQAALDRGRQCDDLVIAAAPAD